jgi:gamma-glutamyltranspeptidase/glutathione hydrolase
VPSSSATRDQVQPRRFILNIARSRTGHIAEDQDMAYSRNWRRHLMVTGLVALTIPLTAHAAPASTAPSTWPAAARSAAEKLESTSMRSRRSRTVSGTQGAISAIASPIATQAGLEILQRGGTAADAATAIAMTQVATQLGSVVSFAGLMSLVYYDKASGKVYSLDAGYNSYRGETDPETIPVADLGPFAATNRTGSAGGGNLPGIKPETDRHDLGRETLVPGFMAGFEAMHKRFGKLAWSSMFDSAIWYAENGVTLSPELASFFPWRGNYLRRTPEGAAFLKGAEGTPKAGDRFFQPELAKTLRAVAKRGAAYMYTGDWAKQFVSIVQREGGKVTANDLKSYRVSWSEPFSTSFAGTTVYAPGKASWGGYNIIPALNFAEAIGLDKQPPYWTDPNAFVGVTGVFQFLEGAPLYGEPTRKALIDRGIDMSLDAQLTKEFAQKAAPLISNLYGVPDGDDHHSNAIVVIDKFGNAAAITHTINSVVWGSTGIVVGGIPIPDSAGFQQKRLKLIKPGDRVTHEMVQTVALRDGKAVFATAGVGSGLVPESLKLILGVLGQKRPLAEVQAAPPLLTNFSIGELGAGASTRRTVVPAGAYPADFLAKVKDKGLATIEMTAAQVGALRGTIVAVTADPATGMLSTSDVEGMVIFGDAY